MDGRRALATLGGDHELDAEVVLGSEVVLAEVAGIGDDSDAPAAPVLATFSTACSTIGLNCP